MDLSELRSIVAQADIELDAATYTVDPDFTIAADTLKRLESAEKRSPGRPRKQSTDAHTIATLDFETDPFLAHRSPKPFAWDFYDGRTHTTYWNKFDESLCVPKLIEFLTSLPKPHIIYAHNGGKFDFLLFRKYLAENDDKNLFVINGRIVSIKFGKHELRDSFAAIPVPLKKFGKGAKKDISYAKLEANIRLSHYDEIIAYLKQDTETLYTYITEYRREFGNVKTMASAAIKEFKKFYTYAKCSESLDAFFRDFYYGGRVQCFQAGVFEPADVHVFDVNSMYPYVMGAYQHPISDNTYVTSYITDATCFVDVEGKNDGAFPSRAKTGLTFCETRGRFKVSIHEFRMGVSTGRFRPERIHNCYNCSEQTNFLNFVEHFYKSRMEARKNGDSAHDLFYKLVSNSAYGKFAQNPRLFEEYQFRTYEDALPESCDCEKTPCTCGKWRLKQDNQDERIMLWAKKAETKSSSFHNILTAASITGAARAELLRGIHNSTHLYYCDTDSLICKSIANVHLDANALGAWKHEAAGDKIAIAGKKMYAIWHHGEPIKKATKGARLSYTDIERVARGETVTWTNEAPTFRLAQSPVFLTRKIRRTA